VSAQVPAAPSATPPKTPPPAPSDPLGRDSPFGTLTGFSSAVHRNEFPVAARYLQAGGRDPKQLEELSRELSDLIDRYFTERQTSLSNAATGDLADGLEPNRERISLEIGDRPQELFLRRVSDRGAGEIWLISSDTLARVPTLHRSATAIWIERVMPESLVSRSFAGLSLAQWILWAVSILGPLLLFWTLGNLIAWIVRRRITDVAHRAAFQSSWKSIRRPLVVILTLLTNVAVMPLMAVSVTSRFAYARLVTSVVVIVASVLIWRLVTVTFREARLVAMRRGRSSTRSLMLLGERVVKVLVVLIAMFVVLALAGVAPTTALAGVGIVGVAVALGAQKSVENLIGAVSLLTDRAIAVGDYCRFADREGWVEDITLRSVRLRTLDQTLLSVPAGMLSQASIENFATRGKILFSSVLRLRYGTTSEQLQYALDGVRRLLATHPAIEQQSARVRLTAFGAQAIEIEVFAYVMTADYLKFLEIREDLLLNVAHIVESSGAAFALPTQFIYMRSASEADRHELAHQP
jgi:MscS family membrane protein